MWSIALRRAPYLGLSCWDAWLYFRAIINWENQVDLLKLSYLSCKQTKFSGMWAKFPSKNRKIKDLSWKSMNNWYLWYCTLNMSLKSMKVRVSQLQMKGKFKPFSSRNVFFHLKQLNCEIFKCFLSYTLKNIKIFHRHE